MKNIYFRRVYTRITEKDLGAVIQSIVIFGKRPYLYGPPIELTPEDREKKRYTLEVNVLQYSYLLQIDLWIFILDFRWKSKEKK